MANTLGRIKRETLREIADAIRSVKGISGQIPVRYLLAALSGKQISTSAPIATEDEYIIEMQTLVDIADVIRQLDGTDDEILVAELAARILGLAKDPNTPIIKKLATPVIALYDDNGLIKPDYNTTAILGKAILGFAILGNASDDGTTIKKLATPVIYLYDDTEEKPEVTTIKLATPVIELVVENDSVENEPTIQKLTTPIIYLEVIEEETEEPDEPDIPEPTVIQLATPIIYLEKVIEGIEKMTFNNSGYIDGNGNIVTYGINGYTGGKAYSNIVAIADLADGPDGYCVQDFDQDYTEYPKVLFFSGASLLEFICGLNVEEIGNKDTLTVTEIKALASNVAGATYIAFNSDFEEENTEDYAYIVEGAETVKPVGVTKLATPIIYLYDDTEEEPIEPVQPTTPKLATPIIYLEEVTDDDT